MRIIAGKFKGRNLDVPKTDLRPTLDRTKETLFNILQFDIPEKNVLDLFAGSGNLGIEALSRGANKVVFVDINKEATKIIKQNCVKCGCINDVAIVNMPFDSAISGIKEKFDIVFADPPYQSDMYFNILKRLDRSDVLNVDAIVVCEHSREEYLPDKVGNLSKYRVKNMGKCGFSFYQYLGDVQ